MDILLELNLFHLQNIYVISPSPIAMDIRNSDSAQFLISIIEHRNHSDYPNIIKTNRFNLINHGRRERARMGILMRNNLRILIKQI